MIISEDLKKVLHDLKTPLTSILGYVELLKTGRDKKTREKFLSIVEFEGKKILHMIDSYIHQEIEVNKNVNCKKLISLVCREFTPDAKKSQINLSYECDDNLLVDFNEIELWRILSNLVGNAIKYNRRGGYVNINAHEESGFVIIECKDNGIGIKKENFDNVFEKNFRENNNIAGSGYGLFNVKEILSKNGGTISVDSIVGKGSKFVVKLKGTGVK